MRMDFRVLHLDLGARSSRVEGVDGDRTRAWIGGKGLAGHLLRPFVTRPWDDPDMPVILMTGPLVGTASPTSGRMCIMSRSPLTGTIGDCSVGGALGTQIRRAGIDGIVISGKSRVPCGIEIVDDNVSFLEAGELGGTDTDLLYARLKDKGAVAVIGPAAEKGVRFASVMVDGFFAAGRNGLGLSFAAKNLKYLTVKGSGKVPVQDPEGLKKAGEDIRRLIAASPVLLGEHGIAHYGTGAIYDLMHSRRMMPTANFRRTHFDAAPAMNAVFYKRKYDTRRAGCRGCHIQCKKVGRDGTHIPEFETMSHFSALWDNRDTDVVVAANDLCNRKGMDTISAGGVLACYAELSGEKLTPLRIMELLESIAAAEGVGKELGQGSYRYARALGHPELSFSVKKQELPAYDPRGAYGMALAYATSTRGGCHLRAYPISHEILRKPVATDRFSFAGKARIVKIAEDMNAVVDSLTACKFVFFGCSLEEYAKAYTAVTGFETSAKDLLEVGERIYYHERIMNALNGFDSADDDLPPRFFEEEGSSGNGIVIRPLVRADFLRARADYYRVRGLTADGLPDPACAARLGLTLESGSG